MKSDRRFFRLSQNVRQVLENTYTSLNHQLKIGRLWRVNCGITGGVVGVADALRRLQRRLSVAGLRERVGSHKGEPGGVLPSKPSLCSFCLSACGGGEAPCPTCAGRQGRAQNAGARIVGGGMPCSHHERIRCVSRSGVRWTAGVSLAMGGLCHNPSHGIDTLADDCLLLIQL